ncbi:hypothetical protein P20311_2818 [Pseudoalteromonas sp. BSi20311]|uniref:lipopolysaccharide biosynthesis protein n=1 Tax=Pseudoalteromonas sp. BSi20311 TaxID=383911 RepID=UPI000231AC4B|nr:oligosaccharide flippase family protein [Pseudoalteromonas sp. BSi20311]GAA65014.1 hypothetical protein P20311_2818 [Pseudoalteromonas sp. BSi20311]
MKKLFTLSLITLVSSSVAFLFLPYISASLSMVSFADYSFLYSLSAVLSGVYIFGTTASYSLAAAEENDVYASDSLQMFFSVNVLLSVIAFIVTLVAIISFNISWALLALPILISGRSIFQVTSHYFRVHKNTSKFAYYQIITLTASFLVPLLCSELIDGFSGVDFIAVMAVILLIAACVGLGILYNAGLLRFALINPIKVTFFRFGLFAALHSLAAALITIMDRFILIGVIDKNTFALYALAATLASALSLFFTIVNQNIAPDFYAKMKVTGDKMKVFYQYLLVYFAILVIAFGLYQGLISYVVDVFFPKEYAGAVKFARILAFASLIQGAYFFGASVLMYFNLSEKLFKITIILGGISIVFGISAYNFFGISGVIYNCILIWFLYTLSAYFVGYRELKRVVNSEIVCS